ncbi:MAG: tRNA (N(6)-L-threonylcarbamoyladenosine(37)-C(2))-methylthiotransferase MtaB [Spirochaetota bacterium]
MLRISAHTFGCKLNQSETDSALNILEDSGYQLVPWDSGADLYLVNTCTVTTKGEQKARRLIRQVQQHSPQAVVLAAGCYAVLERRKLEALGPRVCALPDQPAGLCQLLAQKPLANSDELLEVLRGAVAEQLAGGGRSLLPGVARRTDFPEVLLSRERAGGLPPGAKGRKSSKPRQRYFLKIQDGCNRTCSFCRIRLARGPSRSLDLPLLVQRLQELEAQGYAEAVITGVHINSYHYREQERDYFLGELLEALLSQTERIRLRLSSLEPESLASERGQKLLRALASRRVCPHFHISVQSGSEHILRQMRRGYTAAQQQRYIDRLKELRPAAFFSCDVIVGFPGEREEDFAATCALLRDKGFAAVHGFSYSPRPGTDAFAMPKLQESLVKERMQRLQALGAELQRDYLRQCLGQSVEVLLEEVRAGYWLGYSENYVRTRIAVPKDDLKNDRWRQGDLIRVRLQRELAETVENQGELEGFPLES